MTAAVRVTARPNLIDRLITRWFATGPASIDATPRSTARSDVQEDLRTALEMASACQVSALSGEYAQYLIDRHCARRGERG